MSVGWLFCQIAFVVWAAVTGHFFPIDPLLEGLRLYAFFSIPVIAVAGIFIFLPVYWLIPYESAAFRPFYFSVIGGASGFFSAAVFLFVMGALSRGFTVSTAVEMLTAQDTRFLLIGSTATGFFAALTASLSRNIFKRAQQGAAANP